MAASPIVSNVIVPVPDAFQPALVTVITISPPSATKANTFTCPSTPAANVAVSAPPVVKKLAVFVRLAAPDAAKSSEPVSLIGFVKLSLGRVSSLRKILVPPSSVWN